MQHSSPAALGFGFIFLLGIFAVALAVYVFVCFCYKRICEKAGRQPGVLIWIPFAHFIPLLQAAHYARSSGWLINDKQFVHRKATESKFVQGINPAGNWAFQWQFCGLGRWFEKHCLYRSHSATAEYGRWLLHQY